MMRPFGYIVSVMFLFTLLSCEVKVPENVVSPEKMEVFLYDYHLVQSMTGQYSSDEYKEKLYYSYIFKKHNIEKSHFDSSMLWYSRYPKHMRRIYERLEARLDAEVDKLNAAKNIVEEGVSLETVSLAADSVDLWTGLKLQYLSSTSLNNKLTFSFQVPDDTTFVKNDSLAFICYERAGQAGYAKALTTVADSYLTGRGTAQDSTMAYEYYSRAAAKNEPRALYIIAQKNAQSDSLRQLSQKQLRKQSTIGYYQKAAKLGNANAQYRLAQFYEDGYYVRKSKKKAFNWYLHAANGGHPEAAEKVARMYEKGKGTKRDDQKAAAWYRVALEHGSQTAKEKVEWYNMFRFFSE